jgi:hypothetical protein
MGSVAYLESLVDGVNGGTWQTEAEYCGLARCSLVLSVDEEDVAVRYRGVLLTSDGRGSDLKPHAVEAVWYLYLASTSLGAFSLHHCLLNHHASSC